eukprot:1146433-Pelagomonas_calceolata.AAC.10
MQYEQGRGWQLKPGPGQGRQCKPQALQAPMQGTLPAHMQGFFQAPMRGNLQAPKQGSLRAPVQRTQEPPRLGATNPLPLAEGIPQSLQSSYALMGPRCARVTSEMEKMGLGVGKITRLLLEWKVGCADNASGEDGWCRLPVFEETMRGFYA